MPRSKACVFVDRRAAEVSAAFWPTVVLDGLIAAFDVVALANGPTMCKLIRHAVRSGAYSIFLNLCAGSAECEDAASSLEVARLLEALNVPFTGCRARHLGHTLNDTNMMAHYCGIKLPNFALLRSMGDVDTAARALHFPVVVRGNWPAVHGPAAASSGTTPLRDEAALRGFCEAAFNDVSELLVSEHLPDEAEGTEFHMLVAAGPGGAVRMVGPTRHCSEDATPVAPNDPLMPRFTAAARGVVHSMLGDKGHAMLRMQSTPEGALELLSVEPNCAVSSGWFTDRDFPFYAFVTEQIEAAMAAFNKAQPTFFVCFDAAMKGYFMRAARDLSAGEVVFHDEGRNFPIVTKGFVETHFSDEDKITFSEYGWPLDADGHVYAIWEDDPRTWRPINHSCDPNLVFAAKHSLNVVATRGIKRGEDLTMDYATFCDFTMRPFNCFCKAHCCRGLIRPDAATLAKYTVNAWHRRQPEGFVPAGAAGAGGGGSADS